MTGITLAHTCANCGLHVIDKSVADHAVLPAGWRLVLLQNPQRIPPREFKTREGRHITRNPPSKWCAGCFNRNGSSVWVA